MQRVKIVLMERGIAFHEHNVDLDNRPAEFLELYSSLSPDPATSAKVPILEHGERGSDEYVALIESGNIVEYLEDAFGDTHVQLRPAGPKDAAAVRMFNDAFGSMGWFKLIMGKNEDALRTALVDLARGMRKVERVLNIYGKPGGDFLLGPDYSLAECMAAPLLIRGERYLRAFRDVDMKELAVELDLPRLGRWISAVLERPSTTSTSVDEVTMVSNVKEKHPAWFTCDAKLRYRVSGGVIDFSQE